MSGPYTGAGLSILQDVAGWHAQAAHMVDFLGVAAAVDVPSRAVLIDGDALEVAHFIIDTPVLRGSRSAGGSYAGTADVLTIYTAPPVDGESVAATQARLLRAQCLILRDLLAAAGGAVLSYATDPPVVFDPSDGLGSWGQFGITLTVEAIP